MQEKPDQGLSFICFSTYTINHVQKTLENQKIPDI